MDSIRIQRLAEDVAVQTYPRIGQLTAIPELAVSVWIVDGEYIRTFLDEEFTNFGQHYRFPFIPENEFWLDKENENDESNYFIEHLKVEWNLMRQGASYSDAIVQADLVERAMRLKDADITRVQNPVTKIIDPTKFRLKLIKALDNGLKVWLVDGKLIRTFIHIDFTQGGHEYVYEFVPPGDVWIDNDIAWQERGFIILHELNELNLMQEGWAYTKAHENSSALEFHCRNNPSELHDALINVGWN